MAATLKLEKVYVQKAALDGSIHGILNNISLTCQSGECIGLLGRNGSGKTTLARAMCGLDRPTTGKRHTQPNGVRVGLVLQRPEEHFMHETVRQQVASFAAQKLETTALRALLHQVGLPIDILNRPPLRLSGGQQRLVAIACVLASGAPIIIFDEPMAGLDSNGRKQVSQALKKLNLDQNLGLIIISHHPDDLLGLVERLWILKKGKLIYDDSFQHAPMSLLNTTLFHKETSLYYILRQLQSRGVQLPESIYNDSTAEEIARLLSGITLP